MSIVFALGKAKTSTPYAQLWPKLFKRSAWLFGLGLALHTFDYFTASLEGIRILGVLQRIAIVFFFASTFYLLLSTKYLPYLIAFIFGLYTILMLVVPVPEIGAANLEKGTNLSAWLDQTILGHAHVWQWTRSTSPGSFSWDPEGILSTLPALCSTLLGILLGTIIRSEETAQQRLRQLGLYSLTFLLAGLMLHFTFMPMNKALWTPSFSLFTAGVGGAILSFCFWLMDVRKKVVPGTDLFLAFGSNALILYFSSEMLARLLYFFKWNGVALQTQWFQLWPFEPKMNSLICAISYVAFFAIPALFLYKKKIFIKV